MPTVVVSIYPLTFIYIKYEQIKKVLVNISVWKLIHKEIRIDGLTKHRLTNILSKKKRILKELIYRKKWKRTSNFRFTINKEICVTNLFVYFTLAPRVALKNILM